MDYLEEITENLVSFFTMAAGWTKDKTRALINVWGDANVPRYSREINPAVFVYRLAKEFLPKTVIFLAG